MTGTKRRGSRAALVALAAAVMLCATPALFAQERTNAGTENGEWRYWGGDAASSRYSPLDQINAENFEDLEVHAQLDLSMTIRQAPERALVAVIDSPAGRVELR